MNLHRHQGFTLVEALVALLVLSIGLLGVAALQLTALQNNNNALFRSQATYLAYDIADRMRANRSAALAGGYSAPFPEDVEEPEEGEEEEPEPPCSTVACGDIDAWRLMLSRTLPSGQGSIDPIGANGEATIRIRWDDDKSGAPSIVFVTRTRI